MTPGNLASVAALLRYSHGATTVKRSRCGNGVTRAECEALYKCSGAGWERERCDEAVWKDSDEEDDRGEAKWKRMWRTRVTREKYEEMLVPVCSWEDRSVGQKEGRLPAVETLSCEPWSVDPDTSAGGSFDAAVAELVERKAGRQFPPRDEEVRDW